MTEFWSAAAHIGLVRLEWAILVYFLFVNSFYAVLLASAALEMRQHLFSLWQQNRWRILGSQLAPSISMLAPAYNESATITESVSALLGLHYSNLEVVVINDGSRDNTLGVLRSAFDLVPIHPIYRRQVATQPVLGLYRSNGYPNLVVVDKENGGKSDSLNAGLNVASGDLVCAIDADTLIEADALVRMVRPFLLRDDLLAAGGTIRVANGSRVEAGRVVSPRAPRRPLAGFQVVEYLRAFLFGRLGWNRLGGNMIISGAFGLFQRAALIRSGGYLHATVSEDMEIVVRLRRTSYEQGGRGRVAFVPDPVAWTEVPESLRVLGRQRDRWHRGLAEVLSKHARLLFNPRYGAMGLVVYPCFLFIDLLAPVVEAIGLLGLIGGLMIGAINMRFAVLFFLLAYAYGCVLTVLTLVLEEWSYHRYQGFRDRFLLLLWAVLENLGYRQLTVIWRLRGLTRFLRGRRDWGVMERRGFSPRRRLAAAGAAKGGQDKPGS